MLLSGRALGLCVPHLFRNRQAANVYPLASRHRELLHSWTRNRSTLPATRFVATSAAAHERSTMADKRPNASAAATPADLQTACAVFLVTSPSAEVSRTIAQAILSQKLTACVNVVPRITSMYWWDGKVQEDTEELLIIKSTKALSEEVEAQIKSLHPYDTPEFIRLPIEGGSEEYLMWITDSTRRGNKKARDEGFFEQGMTRIQQAARSGRDT